jgi:hypothetical protein
MKRGPSELAEGDAGLPFEKPLLIGWKERLDFVDWGIKRIKVKIDTGASTSALDVVRYDLTEDGPNGAFARLVLALDRKDPNHLVEVQAPLLGMIRVRNTSGQSEERPLVETEILVGPVRKRIRLTVTNRAGMRFRMILGREALHGDFVVDVGKKYLLRLR